MRTIHFQPSKMTIQVILVRKEQMKLENLYVVSVIQILKIIHFLKSMLGNALKIVICMMINDKAIIMNF